MRGFFYFILSQLKKVKSSIPTKTSDLENDSGFITESSIPTKTSDLENDSGFITESSIPTKTSDLENDSGFITESSIPTKTSDLENDSGFITESSIPTKTSELTNDSGFVTSTEIEGTSILTQATSTTATLIENINKYNKLLIYYHDNDNFKKSISILNNKNSSCSFDMSSLNNNGDLYVKSARCQINGTSLSIDRQYQTAIKTTPEVTILTGSYMTIDDIIGL